MATNLSKLYHIDDIVLASFCPLTLKVQGKEKFPLFSKHLHSFHSTLPQIYETSLPSYTGYMVYMVLINSFKEQRLIYEYETYFYNVLRGYMSKHKLEIDSGFIARAWMSLTHAYAHLRKHIDEKPVKIINYFKPEYFSTRFINISDNKYSRNFYSIIHVEVEYYDDIPPRRIILIPQEREAITNYNVLYLNNLNYNLSTFQINLSSGLSSFEDISPSKDTLRFIKKMKEESYIDVKFPSVFNCKVCPLSQCNKTTLSTELKLRK